MKEKGPTDYGNLIALCNDCHVHVESGKINPKLIRKLKRMQVIRRVTQLGVNALREANHYPEIIASPIVVRHLVDWGYLTTHDRDVGIHVPRGCFSITERGKRLVEQWLQ